MKERPPRRSGPRCAVRISSGLSAKADSGGRAALAAPMNDALSSNCQAEVSFGNTRTTAAKSKRQAVRNRIMSVLPTGESSKRMIPQDSAGDTGFNSGRGARNPELLNESASAVNNQHLAGDEISGGKISGGFGDVVAGAGAMERNTANVVLVGGLAGKLNGAWCDSIHKDLRCQGTGQATREHDRASLRNAIMRVLGPSEQAAERRQIDDAAAAALSQQHRGALRAQELRFQIDVKDFFPLRDGELFEWGLEEHAGVVHLDVEALEFLGDSGEKPPDVRRPRHIRLNRDRPPAHDFDFADCPGGFFARSRVGNVDVRSVGRKTQCHAAADALCASGDHRNLTFEGFSRHAA